MVNKALLLFLPEQKKKRVAILDSILRDFDWLIYTQRAHTHVCGSIPSRFDACGGSERMQPPVAIAVHFTSNMEKRVIIDVYSPDTLGECEEFQLSISHNW